MRPWLQSINHQQEIAYRWFAVDFFARGLHRPIPAAVGKGTKRTGMEVGVWTPSPNCEILRILLSQPVTCSHSQSERLLLEENYSAMSLILAELTGVYVWKMLTSQMYAYVCNVCRYRASSLHCLEDRKKLKRFICLRVCLLNLGHVRFAYRYEPKRRTV